jgi:indolepyruvate ferredoxin oxidoreductase beta subunit
VKYDILLGGVGGQGLMLLSGVMGEACVASNLKVVTSEQHGLAQRSGSIAAHIRIGEAHSPLIPYGSADMIISMEAMEALRNIEYLKPGGTVITSTRLLHPVIETNVLVNMRGENLPYVTLELITERLRRVADKLKVIDAQRLAKEAGNPRTENTVLLGMASATEGFPISRDAIIEAIKRIVPERTIKVNLEAYELGYKA